MWEFLGAATLAVTMNAASAQETKKIGGSRTITATGSDQKNHGDGNVSFVINASNYIKPWKWPAFLASRYTAVIFNGQAADERECPYYASAGRERKLISIDRLIYKVETKATSEEIEVIKKAGCIITETPTLLELGYEDKNDSPSHQIN